MIFRSLPCTQTAFHLHPKGVVRGLMITLAFAVSLPAQSPELANAFARLDASARQFKSVEANLDRDVYTAAINDHAKDSGVLRARREKAHDLRMLIDFTAPDVKSVSIDSNNVRIYYPKMKTVQVYGIGSNRDLLDQYLLLGFGATGEDLKSHYDVTLIGKEQLGGVSTWHLQLIPKSPDVLKNLKKAELWISEATGLPLQQKFTVSTTGDYQLMTYTNMQPNKPLSDSQLKLSYPRDVKEEHPKL